MASKSQHCHYVTGTVIQQARAYVADHPTVTLAMAKKIVSAVYRVKISRGTPHYGANAAARNLRHRAAGTHGL